MKTLILDMNNLIFRVASVQTKGVRRFITDETKAGFAVHSVFQYVEKYWRRFGADRLVLVFDGTNNWRKAYTRRDGNNCPWIYKANRVKDKSLEPFYFVLESFYAMMSTYTPIPCIRVDRCEGDDVIAYLAQYMPGTKVIVSSDRDFTQLCRFPDVKLIDPQTDEERVIDEDLEFWLFRKCIRGDRGDYVHASFPRVQEAKIRVLFEDDIARNNAFENTFARIRAGDEEETTFRVGDVFQENRVLMDLTMQPVDVMIEAHHAIHAEFEQAKHRSFDLMSVLAFCREAGLITVMQNLGNYAPMIAKKTHDFFSLNKPDTDSVFTY